MVLSPLRGDFVCVADRLFSNHALASYAVRPVVAPRFVLLSDHQPSNDRLVCFGTRLAHAWLRRALRWACARLRDDHVCNLACARYGASRRAQGGRFTHPNTARKFFHTMRLMNQNAGVVLA